MLQRLVEYFDQDYMRFIQEATQLDDPLERMLVSKQNSLNGDCILQ